MAASPEATGGIGHSYELASIATYLAALLSRLRGPGCPGPVTGVAVQQRGAGRPLDDLVVDWENALGEPATLDLQLKRRISISGVPDGDFAEIVSAAWLTINLPSFRHGRDLAGGLAEIVPSDALAACEKLHDLARLSADTAAFETACAGQIGRVARNALDVVARILGKTLGGRLTTGQAHCFWRSFVLARLEATSDRGADRLRAIDQLRQVVLEGGVSPVQLFGLLESLAKQLNVRAVRVDRAQVIDLLAERFGTQLRPPAIGLVDALRAGSKGAETELRHFLDCDAAELIEPTFERVSSDNREEPSERIGLAGMEAELRKARAITITGEPGAGKSSALQQIAAALVRQADLVPIVRNLPAVALQSGNMVEQICGRGAFADLTHAHWHTLAEAGHLILLLDGWNELSPAQRQWAAAELDSLQRSYPSILLIVASRSGTAAPLGSAQRLQILPFDRERQFEAAQQLIGPQGKDLLVRARAISSLRPLLRTPIFLAAILRQAAAGSMPSDREAIIAQLVANAGGSEIRREQLRVALDGQHLAFMQAIGSRFMELETTSIAEAELLPVIAASIASLSAAHLLSKAISPSGVLDLLISHHLLVGIGSPGGRIVSIQHHLIQEWLASFGVAERISAQQPDAIDANLQRLIDRPFWAVSILFAVDRLSRSSLPPPALASVVRATLGIEPFLAAEMLVLARPAIGDRLGDDVGAFAEAWLADDPERARSFMLATGLPRFGPTLWSELQTGHVQSFDMYRSARTLPISALTEGWAEHYSQVPEQTRRVLLIDLVEQGEADSVALAVGTAITDPSASVVEGVIDYLDFREEQAELTRLLDSLPEPMWRELVRHRRPHGLTTAQEERWTSYRRDRLAFAEGTEWVDLVLEFGGAAPEAIIDAALNLKHDNHWVPREVQERVFERFPAQFQRAVIARLLSGGAPPYGAEEFLNGLEPPEQQQLLALALSERVPRSQLPSRLLGEAAIGGLVEKVLNLAGDRQALRSKEAWQVRDVLHEVRLEPLLRCILASEWRDAHQAAALAALLANWRSQDRDDPSRRGVLPLPDSKKGELIERTRLWSQSMLGAGDAVLRSELANLATLIGRIGSVALLPVLLKLWDRDYRRREAELAANLADRSLRRSDEIHMSYENQFRDALVGIGGDDVISAMADRLDDPGFEHNAAIVLGQLLEVDPLPSNPLGRSYDDIAARRARLIERRSIAPHPVATKILSKIEALVTTDDHEAITRAFKLAGPLLRMNYGDGGSVLFTLIEAGRDNGLLREFCKAFAEHGETLPAQIVRHGLTTSMADLAAMGWVPDNDYWRVNVWLRLVAFADDAAAALQVDFDLLPEVKRRWRLHDLIFALGYSLSPSAAEALMVILDWSPDLLHETAWPQAMARLGTDKSANLLLDAIVQAAEDPKVWRDTYRLRQPLGSALAASPPARARAFQLIGELQHRGKLTAITDGIAQSMTEADAIALLRIAIDRSSEDIAKALIYQIENAAVTRHAIEGAVNTFELESTPLPELRRAAFQFMVEKPGANAARACLQAIDHLRDRYGKPDAEPNHPDIDSGEPWPSAAKRIWATMRAASS